MQSRVKFPVQLSGARFRQHPSTNFIAARKSSGLSLRHLTLILTLTANTGCGTAVQALTGRGAEMALSSVGLKLPEGGSSAASQKILQVRMTASRDLNAAADGQGLSAVIRMYQLKDQNNFLAAPYATFGNPDKERQAIGADLVGVREVTLSPGQSLELKEQLNNEAHYYGIVALFRAPAPQRWRYAFASTDIKEAGLVLGMHACAMTVTNVLPLASGTSDPAPLSGIKCQ